MASKPLRVCFVIDSLSVAGTEQQLLLLIRHLDRSRVTPSLCLLKEPPASENFVPADCPVICLHNNKLLSVACMKQAIRFRRFLKREKINILQTFFPDSTCFAAIVGKYSGIKRIFGSRRNNGYGLTPKDLRRAKFFNRYLDGVIANAESCKAAVIDQEKIHPQKVAVIPNGVEGERFQTIPTWCSEPEKSVFRIGSVGNLKPVKGTDTFIDAAKHVLEMFPSCRFEIAGTGHFDIYHQQIAARGISDRFQLLGTVHDVPAFLASLDIAVLPSRSEGLSNGLLEYMAAGRPIIATQTGGNTELIRDEENGLLVPPDDPRKMADAILELLHHPEKAARLAENARRSVREKYDADTIAARYCDLYENAIHG
ncbi:MAG: glycosyltransferase [Planctomycetaceae bacterium]|jgi:glycosyltransferase involved in cell wall biosynthesis|nr:glycosyltransferase [Planctomycetaceae bacterium]